MAGVSLAFIEQLKTKENNTNMRESKAMMISKSIANLGKILNRRSKGNTYHTSLNVRLEMWPTLTVTIEKQHKIQNTTPDDKRLRIMLNTVLPAALLQPVQQEEKAKS